MKITVENLPEIIDPLKYYEHSSMSNSDLGKLEQRDESFDPTEAYAFGNLLDHLITEPDKVDVYNNTCDGNVFTQEKMDSALEMRESFMKNPLCKSMVDRSDFQTIMHKRLSHQFGDVYFAIDARCKWDLWMHGQGWGGDIKTTTATTFSQFKAACKHFHYPRQRFVYMTLGKSKRDLLIGISKVNYKVFIIPITKGDDFYNEGKADYEKLVVEYWKLYGGI